MSKKNILLKSLTALAMSAMLFSCNGGGTNESSSSSNSDTQGVKGDIITLSNTQNLTISIGITTASGAMGLSYKNYYTPAYVYSEDFFNGDWGYIEGSEGIYPIAENEEEADTIIPGEVLYSDSGLLLTGLWDQGLFPYFSSLNTDELPTTTGDYTLTNKLNILTMLDIYGFSRSRYLEVESVVLHGGDSLTDFNIKLTLGSTIYLLSVVDTEASNEMVDSFLADGGTAYVVDEFLDQMRTLFKADNYQRDVIDYDSGESIGTEVFMPDYFYGDYDTTVSVPWGLMKFENETITYGGYSYSVNGCYYFTIQSNQIVLSPTQPYNSSTDIASVCFYIHDPLLFSSFQYCEQDEETNNWVITKEDVLIDFAENNQVYDSIQEVGASLYRLEIDLDNIFDESGEVNFTLYYGYSETNIYPLQYRFLNFGNAGYELIDNFIKTAKA